MKRSVRSLLVVSLSGVLLANLSSCSKGAAGEFFLTPPENGASPTASDGVRPSSSADDRSLFDVASKGAASTGEFGGPVAPAGDSAAAGIGAGSSVEGDRGHEPTPDRWLADDGSRSAPLSCGLFNPMPGGVTAGYMADTGLDLAGTPRDVFAIGSGVLEYSERGHTAWRSTSDSPFAIRLRLDTPLEVGDRAVTHVWYAHLSSIIEDLPEGGPPVRVAAGQRLGTSGTANGCAHLHLGLLLDGDVEQGWGTFLREDAVRGVLCGVGTKVHLPDR